MPANGRTLNMPPRGLHHFRHIEVSVFIFYRPFAAVLAALATSGVFAMLDLLLRYAAR
jgi:hypothetical protein